MSFFAVHQTECIVTMVIIIAGPHFTLQGPDSFLQIVCPTCQDLCLWILIEYLSDGLYTLVI